MTESWRQELFRAIPKVDDFLARAVARQALETHPRWMVLDAVREVLESRRRRIIAFTSPPDEDCVATDPLEEQFLLLVKRSALPRLSPVLNATGIIVHTNLGRSPLAPEAVAQVISTVTGYSNLEYDLAEGRRGSRQDHVTSLLRRLTGAEEAIVVNNNAAAVMLSLTTLAAGREVIVSRGQLVEIGGSFRIPDVMRSSGAILREVGATNKTNLEDYRRAVGSETALLLKVHTSNYRIVGFSASVELPEMAALGREKGIPVMEDLGSGCLVDLSPFGLRDEPTVPAVIAAGADLVTFSGDKLLGGPQAGIVAGRRDLVEAIRRHPVHRAVRADKFTLAALEATLRLYLEGEEAFRKIPTLRMISEDVASVRRRARRTLRRLSKEARREFGASVVDSLAQVGGGSLPLQELPSAALALSPESRSLNEVESLLRSRVRPVVGRIHEESLLLDHRTVADDEVPLLAAALEGAASR